MSTKTYMLIIRFRKYYQPQKSMELTYSCCEIVLEDLFDLTSTRFLSKYSIDLKINKVVVAMKTPSKFGVSGTLVPL